MLERFRNKFAVVFVLAAALAWTSPSRVDALSASKRIEQCRLDVWGAREGLPGYDITALAQTPDGYIWVGTTAGLYRFDGQTFTRFDRSTVKGLTSNLIRSLLVTRSGQLWVGTEWGGFGQLIGNTFTRVDSEKQWNVTNSLHEAADGTILAGYMCEAGKELLSYHGALTKIPLPGGIFSSAFADLPDRSILTSLLYDRLRIYRNGKFSDYPLTHPLHNTDLRCMIRRANGSIWLGTDFGGVIEIKGSHWAQFTTVNNVSSNAITCLYEDNVHRLLIGTNNGLDVWTSRGIEHIRPADGLGDYRVNAIMEDREGNLWVATGKKLNRFSDTALSAVNVSLGKQPALNMAAPMNDGGILCATRDGLYEQPAKPNLPAKHLFKQGLEGVRQLSDGDIVTWNYHPGPGMHFDIRRGNGGSWKYIGQIDFSPIGLLREAPLTFVGYGGEVETLGSKTHVNMLAHWGNPRLFDVTHDVSGTIWIGCEAGVMRVINRHATLVDAGVPSGAHVLSVDVRDPHCMWLGTDKGLVRYKDGHGTLYGTESGLPDDDLLQVVSDNNGKLWVGGYFGIFSIKAKDVDAYDQHRIKSIPSTLYATADGVHSYPMLSMPVYARTGLIWFVGQDGLTAVDPNHLSTNGLPPPVVVDIASVDGEAITVGDKNVVRPGRGAFNIHFAALSFSAPEKVRFRYRLVGYDSAWVDAGGQHSATYTNLPPGTYTFQVTACNNNGVWAIDPASIRFTIRPHFYQTLWFRVACVGGIVALILGIGRLRFRQMVRQARELERKVAERTAQLASANAEVTQAHDRLQERNSELQEMQAELEAQNTELQETQQTLAEANERLQALATTDGLTGLINHRSFQERLETEWARHQRENTPLSLILIDVDNFKSYNDTYGHPAGDDVLRSVAQVLKDIARVTDVTARYGGEEFVVIAPDTDAEGVDSLGERLRAAVECAEWPLRSITGSFGVATSGGSSAPIDSPAALIAAADAALYRSKRSGKNRVTASVADPSDAVRSAA